MRLELQETKLHVHVHDLLGYKRGWLAFLFNWQCAPSLLNETFSRRQLSPGIKEKLTKGYDLLTFWPIYHVNEHDFTHLYSRINQIYKNIISNNKELGSKLQYTCTCITGSTIRDYQIAYNICPAIRNQL